MKLATLYENYVAMDFDLEIAAESKIVLCETFDEAKKWAEAEVREGRDPETKWEWADSLKSTGVAIFYTGCNEYGAEEENWLIVRNIKKL